MCAWRWLTVWLLVTGAAVVASQMFLDEPVARWARWAGFDSVRGAFEVVTLFGMSSWYLLAIALMTLIAWLAGVRRLAWRLTFILISLMAASLLVQGLKIVAGRYRPKALVDDGLYGFTWFDFGYETASFPSGHAATIAALAAAMWILVPRWRDLWLIPVALVAASRILLGSHYVSDVIAGAFIGAATTFVVYRLLRSRGVTLDAGRSRPTTPSVSHLPLE